MSARPTPADHPVDIVIPVYNGLRHTRACLDSLRRWTDPATHRLIVVDDASTPTTATAVADLLDRHWGQRALLLTNEHNLGFVQTANRGMAAGTSPVVVLLNSDTLVAPGWLDGLTACLDSSPDVGIASPVSNHANLTRIDVPYGVDHLRLAAAVRRISPRAYPEIRFAMGFCMVARRPLLEELDFFDERYGRGYREESDLCMRAEALGWRTVADDATYVHHHGWGSFGHEARTAQMEHNGELFRQRWGAAPEELQRPIRRQRLFAELEERLGAALQGRAQVAPRRPLPRRANRRVAEEARRLGPADPGPSAGEPEPRRRGERHPPTPTWSRREPEAWQRIAASTTAPSGPPEDADDALVLVDDLVLDPFSTDVLQLVDRLSRLGLRVNLATSGSFDPAAYSDPCRVRPFVLAGPDELLATVPRHRVVLATSPATVFDALLLRERDGSEVATWFDPQAPVPRLGWPGEDWLAVTAPGLARAHLGPAVPEPLLAGAAHHPVPLGVDADVYPAASLEGRPPAVLLTHDLAAGPATTAVTTAVAHRLIEDGLTVSVYGDPLPDGTAEHLPYAPQELEASLLARHAVVVETGPVPGLERLRLRCAATGTPIVLAGPTGPSCPLEPATAAMIAPRGDVARLVELATRTAHDPASVREQVAAATAAAARAPLDDEASALAAAITAVAEGAPPPRRTSAAEPSAARGHTSAGSTAHLLQLAREGGNRVLQLGCGDGALAIGLARDADKELTCVDTDDEVLQRLAEHPVRRTVRADVEDERWLAEVAGEQFDVVVLAVPLLQLGDPGRLLRGLREHRLLAANGHLVLHIADHTDGAEELERARRLLEQEGVEVTRILRPQTPPGLVLRAEPLGADLTQLEHDLARATRRAHRAATQRDQAQRRAAALQRQLDQLQQDVRALEQRLADVHASRTWRAGRLLVGLPAAIRQTLRRWAG